MAESKVQVDPNIPVVSCPVCGTRHLPVEKGCLKNGIYATDCENCGFFFKFKAKQQVRDTVTFSVNGVSYTVTNEYDPATSLNEYLRTTGVSRGTKQMCIEGGCGVCLVTIKLYDPVSEVDAVYTVNSLYMCDGWDITTIEGLGNTRSGLHPIQQRLAKYNGSQCGFCSPAQVMNMYGLLQKKAKPTKKEVEDIFDSTICRCTGYRSILDAMKSFSVDAPPSLPGGPIDIEDLDRKVCRKSGQPCIGQCQETGAHSECGSSGQGRPEPLHMVSARAQWLKPTNTEQLYELLEKYKHKRYRLVFGNTGFGVYKDIGPWLYDILIDLRGIDFLYHMQIGDTLMMGSGVSLTNLKELCEQHADNPDFPYFPGFARHLELVASHSIRNMASWAGSLMLKHLDNDFVSDIFTLLETVQAQVLIGKSDGDPKLYSLVDFLKMDMTGKVILSAVLPRYRDKHTHISTFRVSQRLQSSHGYVTAGFNFMLDADTKYTVLDTPVIVYQGINSKLNRATETEKYLKGKQLGNPTVLKGALDKLQEELNPSPDPVLASPEYRLTLAQALFYKFVLQACPTAVDARYASGATQLERPVSSGVQSYGTDEKEWPLTEPLMKRDAVYQTTGEVRYLDDERLVQDEVFASFVISDVANAYINEIDASAALKMAGVYKFITASDFPAGGENNFMPMSQYSYLEEIFSSGKVLYAGQPVGLIVACDVTTAETAAAMVKVTYKDGLPPLVDLPTAIEKQSFFPKAVPQPLVTGDPDGAIAKSPKSVSGRVECGSQYHFQLETQIARCCPSDDGGMNVQASTQWIDGTIEVVADVLNIPQSSVTVEVKRVGGGFGSKISCNFQVSGACALAAYIMQRPVRLRMGFHTNMKTCGKRYPFLADYEAGFTKDGLLNGVKVNYYGDCGVTPNDNSIGLMYSWMDSAYYCKNWKLDPKAVMTNLPSNTYCRAPGSVPAQFIMESIMEHVAKSLNKDPTEVRVLNLYKKGQKTPQGVPLNYCSIGSLVKQLKDSAQFNARKTEVDKFNKENRWKKRGLTLIPTRYGQGFHGEHFNVFMAVYHADATVAIQHAGIDMGQGINQKLRQVCAYELGIPLSLIRVKKGSSITNCNSATTGSSITSEINALGVIQCCEMLKKRLAPVKAKMDKPTWQELVQKSYAEGIDLCARFYTNPQDKFDYRYSVYGATVAEAELDVLTGQSQLRRVDLLYDCGKSMSPEIDIGQVEGGFMMGLGYHLLEKLKLDPKTGQLLTAGTWEYKPPMPKDLPVDFRVSLLKDAPSPAGVLGSKTSGEPPLVMASSGLFAIKHAAEAARAEIGQDNFFPLDSPALVEDVQTACLVKASQFVFGK